MTAIYPQPGNGARYFRGMWFLLPAMATLLGEVISSLADETDKLFTR